MLETDAIPGAANVPTRIAHFIDLASLTVYIARVPSSISRRRNSRGYLPAAPSHSIHRRSKPVLGSSFVRPCSGTMTKAKDEPKV